ncbi:hypothetical protein SS1G_02089 [Sclerotinia sclerotiorum 1980 UF-70]|uniref:Uncharacterized protein n=1 Tax=Sclerotinia sclerotiorum (strain ATCC 18683 / 1980 / Ss-1) TaxID=665079 RepID=A7E9V9_SCLS1|nr:hypothetical protein SS1G_02089 [Sclerotinia sclerotiorum 1980 UF-70]EDN97161.1 hypothetical protein SS1G_02089 [Sclerotinia sclerotiorum 1980 UF-70]
MRVKYGIIDFDFYNFDETSFIMAEARQYNQAIESGLHSQIEEFTKAYINHITKVEFFMAFKAAYQQSINSQNIKAGFRGTGLIPFDPQAILSKLDIRIYTPTPPPFDLNLWISQTPHNPTEALSQSTLMKLLVREGYGRRSTHGLSTY